MHYNVYMYMYMDMLLFANLDYAWFFNKNSTYFYAQHQGFSQDFRIGCPKRHIWGELGVQFLFNPLHYTQKIWILGC